MAEFQEVCKQWSRMCANCDCGDKEHNYGKMQCPITYKHNGYPCDDAIVDMTLVGIAQLEEIVMEWAAEHPEPVYPTWGEWLEKQGIAKLVNSDRYEEDGRKVYVLLESVDNQIPADIAEKIGLKPKEV